MSVAVLAQDRRNDVVLAGALRREGKDLFCRQPRQDGVLIHDVVELALQSRQLVLAQAEACEMGDVLDVLARQGGHGAKDSGAGVAGRPQTCVNQATCSEAPTAAAASAAIPATATRRSPSVSHVPPATRPVTEPSVNRPISDRPIETMIALEMGSS